MKLYARYLLLAIIGLTTAVGYTNCSGQNAAFDTSTVSTSSTTAWTFSYTPNPLYVGNTATLATSGGTAPYTYAVTYGSGVVNGSYYSTSAEGYATILVKDAIGATQYFTIYAYSSNGTSSYTSLPATATADIYRFSAGGIHFFTANYAEGANAGLIYEGVGFRVLTTYAASSMPLYRCYISSLNRHFVSTVSNCSGYLVEGSYGYIYNYAAAGSTPLYGFYSASTYDYLATTNYNEGVAAGYTYMVTYGYVPL